MLLAGACRRLLAAVGTRTLNDAGVLATCPQCAQYITSATLAAGHPARVTTAAAAKLSQLSDEQAKQLQALAFLVQRPLALAHSAGVLAALTATYRDLYVSMDQLHKKDVLGVVRPLVEVPPPPYAAPAPATAADEGGGAAPRSTQMFFPVRDLTKLPDRLPENGLLDHLRGRYMDKITCWAQLLPNHLEVSYQTDSTIMLWPAQEAFFPMFIDFDRAHRKLTKGARQPKTGLRRRRKSKPRCKLG